MITASGADVYLGKDTFDIGRNFANKLWNASRFLLSNIENPVSFTDIPPADRYKAEDHWIISRLQSVIESMNDCIENFRFNEACHIIYDFTWRDFCDWYIEAKKADLYQQQDMQRRSDAIALSSYILSSILKLLQPIMPFITEEIWSHLRGKVCFPSVIDSDTIMCATYPKADKNLINSDEEKKFGLLQDIITALRTIRSENNIPPDKQGNAVIIPTDPEFAEWMKSQSYLVNQFAKLATSIIDVNASKPEFAGSAVLKGNQVFLSLEGLIDKNVEIERLTKEITRVSGLIQSTKARLENESFISRAPKDIVDKEKEKLNGLIENLDKLDKNLKTLQS